MHLSIDGKMAMVVVFRKIVVWKRLVVIQSVGNSGILERMILISSTAGGGGTGIVEDVVEVNVEWIGLRCGNSEYLSLLMIFWTDNRA